MVIVCFLCKTHLNDIIILFYNHPDIRHQYPVWIGENRIKINFNDFGTVFGYSRNCQHHFQSLGIRLYLLALLCLSRQRLLQFHHRQPRVGREIAGDDGADDRHRHRRDGNRQRRERRPGVTVG